jgi:hypothetical protein
LLTIGGDENIVMSKLFRKKFTIDFLPSANKIAWTAAYARLLLF